MKHLIVGYGEVGKALHKVLGEAYIIDGDKLLSTNELKPVDVVHICFPYSKNFKEEVNVYKKLNALIIVHSTVPVGTCDELGVTHSPIRGIHPYLEKGIRTFVKYFGGKEAHKAALIFFDLGIKTREFKDAKITEALKLWDTTQYGRLIMLEKEIHQWCVDHNVDFEEVYINANKDYNEGYVKLGRPDVVRPWLTHMDGPIGGHCVVPNAKLLGVEL